MKKSFVKSLLPDYKFAKVTEISHNFFEEAKLVIFDVDNTLFFSETTKIEQETINWFKLINQKYNCILLSNSPTINKRKEKISELLGCKIFLSSRNKPSKKLFKEIKKEFKLNNNDKVVVVGDRILTDIFFGNRNGAVSVMVNPISREREVILIRVIRALENFILLFLKIFYQK